MLLKKNNELVEFGIAMQPIPGQDKIGDSYMVDFNSGGALIAVVDGLGHGEEAAYAAKYCIDILKAYTGQSIVSLINICHKALVRTRGVVMSLASFNAADNTMTWAGVGNVEGMLLKAGSEKLKETEKTNLLHQYLPLYPGVIGYQFSTIKQRVVSLHDDDTLIFTTDGISTFSFNNLDLSYSPELLARHILDHNFKGTDDALVLVARWRGENE